MENASKALIIAGAILIAVLIVSLGIFIFRGYFQKEQELSNLSEQEVSNFNSQFSKFEGKNNVSGATVNNLIKKVVTSNTSEISKKSGKYVFIKYTTIDGSDIELGVNNNHETIVNSVKKSYNQVNQKVQTNRIYTVDITLNDNTGLIQKIVVK